MASVALRGNFDAAGVRRLALEAGDVGQARRLLATAAVYQGDEPGGGGAPGRHGPADSAGLGSSVQ